MRPPFYREWWHRFDDRLDLRRRALNALGISLPTRPTRAERDMIRETLIGCTTCAEARACAAWLALGDTDTPPVFCQNRETYLKLMDGYAA